MRVVEEALDLIGLAYDAALAPEKWRAFMERAARSLDARSAALREVNYKAEQVRLFETVGFDPAFVAAYRQHFVHIDTLAPTYLTMPIGRVVMTDEFVPWEVLRNTEFGSDYMLAQNIRHMMGAILARDEHRHLLFGVQREVGQPGFDEEDRRLLGLVAPHIARAAHIHRKMAKVTAERQWALSALDRLRVGVILLDEQGRPVHLNRAAERLAGGRHGFGIGRNGLTLASTADSSRLKRLIADAAALAAGRRVAGGGCLRSACNGTTLHFQVIPLPRGLSERPLERSLPGGCVAVFVSTARGPRLPWERVAAMHGLTRAEAKLAALMAEGVTVEQAAEKLSVSAGTARSQLKAIFAKTGVSRQAELVALLLADVLNEHADSPAEAVAS